MKTSKKIAIIIIIIIIILVLLAIIANFAGKTQKPLTDKNSVSVYFVKTQENSFKLSPIRRKMDDKEKERLEIALNELLKGLSQKEKIRGYVTEIPVKTELLELEKTPERIMINLSQDFENGGGSASMTLRLQQLINTVLDSVDQKPVYLELDGKQIKHLGGEGVMVPQPLSRNLSRGQDI